MREAVASLVVAMGAVAALAGSPARAVLDAYWDAQRLPPDAAQHAAYLWNDGDAASWPLRVALVRHQLAAVSTTPDGITVIPVGPDLVRIDRRDPGPAFAVTWEHAGDVADPLFHLAIEAVDYDEHPRRVQDYQGRKWMRNDADNDWLPYDPKNLVIRTPKKGTKKHVLATEEIDGCPACAGWLPTKETLALAALTYTQSPVLGAQWWWARAERQLPLSNVDDGTGYYDWMGVKSRDDFFKILHVHADDDVHVFRGVFAPGQSLNQNGRGVERPDALFGGRWVTLDPNSGLDARNVTEHLVRGELVHDAEEHIGPGPNGLEKDLLCNDKGVLQASAPDFISSISNPRYGGMDNRIHVNLGCKECHGQTVLLPLNHEWARKTFPPPARLQSPDYQTNKDFQTQLFSNLEGQRAKDARAMIEAAEAVSGMKYSALCDAQMAEWKAYATAGLDADAYGRLFGIGGKEVVRTLLARIATDPINGVRPALAPLEREGGVIDRVTAEQFMPVMWSYLKETKP